MHKSRKEGNKHLHAGGMGTDWGGKRRDLRGAAGVCWRVVLPNLEVDFRRKSILEVVAVHSMACFVWRRTRKKHNLARIFRTPSGATSTMTALLTFSQRWQEHTVNSEDDWVDLIILRQQ